jgi:thymidylate synthase
MKIYRGQYIATLYRDILNDLLNNPEYISKPRDLEVREILNCIIEVQEPNMNMYKNEIRSSKEKYIGAEILWYFSGTNKVNFIENHAGMWSKLKNENNEANSAYGNLLFTEKNEYDFTQYEWAIVSLKKDKDSRQAFMHFNKPWHQYEGNPDQVCTLTALFHIRDNRLHMTLNMRSNDVILGFMTDFTFFNLLHQQVFIHLKKYYPELQMGTYTHTSHSMHLYKETNGKNNYDLVEKMLMHDFTPHATPLLTKTIISENGMFLPKYKRLFRSVINNFPIDVDETNNELLNWCILKIC